jgi:hypothetical protein
LTAWWKPPVTTHSKSDGTPCDGILVWGKDTLKITPKTVIRRECPVCGLRQRFNPKMQQWLEDERNPAPGTGGWVNGRYQ